MPNRYAKMNGAGWISGPLATSCHAAITEKTPLQALKKTRTYREFSEKKTPPKFDPKGAIGAHLLFVEGKMPISVNKSQSLIQNDRLDSGKNNVAYLEDVRAACILARK